MIHKFYLLLLLSSLAQAHEYKAVFDCSSDDAKYILSRMMLLEKTITMIEKDEERAKFALTLHGGCVAMVSKSYEDMTPDDELVYVSKAQETIKRLAEEKNVTIVACAMSLKSNAIAKGCCSFC
ncbi:MAG: hypothetical protein PHU40_11940 [Sulfurimonas sp.]|nr:hypothetical protein [Sulfurimonas sp.]